MDNKEKTVIELHTKYLTEIKFVGKPVIGITENGVTIPLNELAVYADGSYREKVLIFNTEKTNGS